MKKIPTLFKREFDDKHHIKNTLPIVTEGMEWVLEGKGIATIKYDGACCAIIDGVFYKRYDAKHGKPIPDDAIKCQTEADTITGHLPCWKPVYNNNPEDKWFVAALNNKANIEQINVILNEDNTLELPEAWFDKEEQIITYEVVGQHFNGNPYNLDHDMLIMHGDHIINVDRTYEGIKTYLQKHCIEGIVFWKDGEPQCKIKRSDFGFEWNKKIK